MSRPEYAAVTVHGPVALLDSCPGVTVIAVAETREALRFVASRSGQTILPLCYQGDRRPPVKGDELGTWSDFGTIYAMAPRR